MSLPCSSVDRGGGSAPPASMSSNRRATAPPASSDIVVDRGDRRRGEAGGVDVCRSRPAPPRSGTAMPIMRAHLRSPRREHVAARRRRRSADPRSSSRASIATMPALDQVGRGIAEACRRSLIPASPSGEAIALRLLLRRAGGGDQRADAAVAEFDQVTRGIMRAGQLVDADGIDAGILDAHQQHDRGNCAAAASADARGANAASG